MAPSPFKGGTCLYIPPAAATSFERLANSKLPTAPLHTRDDGADLNGCLDDPFAAMVLIDGSGAETAIEEFPDDRVDLSEPERERNA